MVSYSAVSTPASALFVCIVLSLLTLSDKLLHSGKLLKECVISCFVSFYYV